MNLDTFFKSVRRSIFGGSLTVGQVEGMEKILAYWQDHFPKITLDEMAYILATIAWETGRKMQPVREAGGEAYLRTKKYYPWVGEGLVQVTWRENAIKFGAKKPGDLMEWPIALHAAFKGMTEGVFTGKKLADYIGPGRKPDYVNARRIINGTDKAQEIARIAENFRLALMISRKPAEPIPPPPNDNYATFKSLLIRALTEDPEIRGIILAVVFPDDAEPDSVDPMDEEHPEYGNEPENVAYYDDDYASETERNPVV